MATFTQDWSVTRAHWPALFEKIAGAPGLRFLEIGCFEGHATVWLLDHVLTDPSSTITAIDTFDGSPEFEQMGVSVEGLRARFEENVRPYSGKVETIQGRSQDVLAGTQAYWRDRFHCVYVDGAHDAPSVLADAVLAWPLLRRGGMMIFDDYDWGGGIFFDHETPRLAVDAFVSVFREQLAVLDSGTQFVVLKV